MAGRREDLPDPAASAWGPSLIPRLPGAYFRRERLLGALTAGSPVVVVDGPARSGKTSLVADWARERGDDGAVVLWVAAASRFRDLRSLWFHLLDRTGGEVPPTTGEDRARDILIARAAAADRPIVVVLDDCEGYLSAEHVSGLATLIAGVPHAQLVLVGAPVPEVGRTWAEFTSIEGLESGFTFDELGRLSTAAGLRVASADVQWVHELLRGWLEPSLMMLREIDRVNATVTGRLRPLSDARRRAVMEPTDERMETRVLDEDLLVMLRPFWLWTLAGQFTEEAAAVALGTDRVWSSLLTMEHQGLVRRADEEDVLRWIPQLSEIAQRAIARRYSAAFPEAARNAERRLAAWHRDGGRSAEALTHAVSSADWDLVAEMLETEWSRLLIAAPDVLRAALDAVPRSLLASSPSWAMARAYTSRMPPHGRTPVSAFAAVPPDSAAAGLRDRLAAINARMMSERMSGDLASAVRSADQLHELLDGAGDADRVALVYGMPDLLAQTALTRLLAGHVLPATLDFGEAYDNAIVIGHEIVAMESAGTLALLDALAGNRTGAEAWLTRMPPPTDPDGWYVARTTASAQLAVALLATDALDFAAAREKLTAASQTTQTELWALFHWVETQVVTATSDPLLQLTAIEAAEAERRPAVVGAGINRTLIVSAKAHLLLAAGRTHQARLLLASSTPDPDPYGVFRGVSLRSSLLIGTTREVRSQALHGADQPGATFRERAESALLAAAASDALGDDAAADEQMRQAMVFIREMGLEHTLTAIPFERLAPLLERSGIALPPGVVDRVREASRFSSEPVSAGSLTERELQVLRELVDGRSVRAIASRLFVSPNTIKSQVRSIYRKLGTSSRAETAALAARTGLLAPAEEDATDDEAMAAGGA